MNQRYKNFRAYERAFNNYYIDISMVIIMMLVC